VPGKLTPSSDTGRHRPRGARPTCGPARAAGAGVPGRDPRPGNPGHDQQDLIVEAAFDPGDRRGGGAQEADSVGGHSGRKAHRLPGRPPRGRRPASPPTGEAAASGRRGVPHRLPRGELDFHESGVVVLRRPADGRALRRHRLEEDLARPVAATRTSRKPGSGSGRCAPTPEVGERQGEVGQQHPDEGDLREVVPLGDHLRPDEDVHFPRCIPERTSAYAPRFRVTSESSRATRASFHRFETQERSRSCRFPPGPACARRTSRTFPAPCASRCSSGTGALRARGGTSAPPGNSGTAPWSRTRGT